MCAAMIQTTRSTMLWTAKHIGRPTAIATVFVVPALFLTFPLQRFIAYPFLFLFLGASMGAAWFGGFLSGILATFFSTAIITYFFLRPIFSFSVDYDLRTYEAAFIACAIVIAAISAARKRAETAVRFARDELEVRVRERTVELEHTNQEILERERQLQLLTEAIPLHIWRANSNGEIDYCNRDLLEFAAVPFSKLCGEGLFSIYHPADRATFRTAWTSSRKTGEKLELRLRICGAGDTYRWFLVRVIPQHTASGALSCWYGVHVDIEDQYQAQQELQAAQGESARWSRTLSVAEMAVSIAHEIKQPLTAIVTQAQICKRWLCSEPASIDRAIKSTDKLVYESVRASSIIDRIRALYCAKEPMRELTNLNDLIHETVQLSTDHAIRKGVAVQLSLAEDLPQVEADPIQIRQLLLNLTINAIEAAENSGQPGIVTISTFVNEEGRPETTICDNGVGIDEGQQEKMFDAFFTTKKDGLGIGLSVCRSIVEAHGGRIWAVALPQGTAFHFVLGEEG